MKNDVSPFSMFSLGTDLNRTMKESYDFWNKNYNDSLVNYALVWKKAMSSNSEIIQKIKLLKKHSKQNTEIQMDQFLEIWFAVIRQSNFEIAHKSIKNWDVFWKNTTEEQFRVYANILELLEKYWKNIQSKNIE